jgi:hypothetical protein
VRPRLALLVVLVFVLLFAWAALTFAFDWHVVFGQAKRAPHSSRVFKLFDTMDVGAPPGMASGVIPNQTRKVATFGKTQLWVAPTAEGGFCDLWIGGFGGGGGCERLGVMPLVASYGSRGRAGDGTRADPRAGLREIDGSIKARWSDSVEIRFEDGTVIHPRLVWVSAPIEAGFFYQEIPNAYRLAGHRLKEVVAVDGKGNVVFAERPFSRSDSESGPPAGTLLDRAEDLLRIQTPGGEAVQRSAPTRYDGHCSWLEFDGRTYASSCAPEGYRKEGSSAELIRLAKTVLISATVSDRASVMLEFADGDRIDLHPKPGSNGLVLFKLGRDQLEGDSRLTRFAVLNASGEQTLNLPFPFPQAGDPDR